MKIMKFHIVNGIAIFLTILCISYGCRISAGWHELTMEERLVLSDIVVYGKTKQHVASTVNIDGESKFFIDAVFEVYCVLKSDESFTSEEITIAAVAPRDGCSGPNNHMRIDDEVIIGLKSRSDGKYEYHEVMPTQSATFAPSRSNFFTISQICGIQQWQAPTPTSPNRCPICGISNFTETSIKADENDVLSPCVINGINFGNGTNCNLFQNLLADNTTVCIPTAYSSSCGQIPVSNPGVTCDCSADDNQNRNPQYVDVNSANGMYPALISFTLALFVCCYVALLH